MSTDAVLIKQKRGILQFPLNQDNDKWRELIDTAERLLIYSHWPGGNSSGLNKIDSADFQNIHILNWGNRRDLLPEVSGKRWVKNLDPEFKPFSMK